MPWDIVERFEHPALSPALWIPYYLPHWVTLESAAARFAITDLGLELRIDADQPPWRPTDGDFRVSHVQTGHRDGQHRVGADLAIVTPRPTRALWTARAGAVEVVASVPAHPATMLGIWLLGDEAGSPDDSGEICIAELFGPAVSSASSTVRTGVKAHHDPRLVDEMLDIPMPLDATRPHAYGARWDAGGCEITVDGTVVHRSDQVLDYPLQLMIDLWEFPEPDAPRDPAAYPLTATIHQVRLRADG
ncbi:glycoside hydrolase family 16 protein [Demequina sp. SYSU T00039]|uniref:Glycoside hydrolase family 16 protein n=1 Tax=Demequina lignilytica TaxID=3051663 RepID=A0AAW7M8P1_9MICO|nr:MULTISPECIES: glycoside hydrolase family 16 protein [unclassified Demequina]MDN4478317.1 glycoside hydrolase family 16 protein [Demequina sp. SYSU T00039-1]MDN4487176.1 glycoside hydrolase family 16 protein [Demequina sp. SYSU T00039]MDN4489887.1 glycoside hydrolase family 16 protein [Demequina sp. SYSU T00068]